jgi:hypothetical protein
MENVGSTEAKYSSAAKTDRTLDVGNPQHLFEAIRLSGFYGESHQAVPRLSLTD